MRNQYANRYNPSPLRSLWERIKRFLTENSALSNLLIANIGIAILMWTAQSTVKIVCAFWNLSFDFHQWVWPYVAFPADVNTFLHHPWTLLTSLFIHNGFWHLLFNMVMLYVIGRFFLQYLSQKKFLITYFIGGVVGNFLYMLAFNIIPTFTRLAPVASCVGASGAIMAIMLAITLYRPNHPIGLLFIGRITLKWVAIIFIVIDLLSIADGQNAGGHFAHLGGALYGAASALFFHHPMKEWKIFSKKVKFEKRKGKYYSSRPMSDEDFNAKKHADEQRVDAILDKISQNGYGALSKEEKDFLYKYKR